MEYIFPIGVVFVLPILFTFIDIRFRRRLVQELVWSLLNSKGTKGHYVAFMDSSPEQLLYPLTPEQLSTIRACRSFERTTAEVKGIRPLDGLLNDYYFTVHYDICGVSGDSGTFSIREDAYLRVCFLRSERTIFWIVGSREAF